MTHYDSTARVPFKHGGSVKKPKVKRIILWKGKAKEILNKHEPEVLNPPVEFDDDIPF